MIAAAKRSNGAHQVVLFRDVGIELLYLREEAAYLVDIKAARNVFVDDLIQFVQVNVYITEANNQYATTYIHAYCIGHYTVVEHDNTTNGASATSMTVGHNADCAVFVGITHRHFINLFLRRLVDNRGKNLNLLHNLFAKLIHSYYILLLSLLFMIYLAIIISGRILSSKRL